jgi:hypothetical protein
MVETASPKVCPLCAETIKAAARVCPFCQTRQSRYALLKGQMAGVMMVLIVCSAAGFAVDWAVSGTDETSFLGHLRYRNYLSGERVKWVKQGGDNFYSLTGFVTNRDNMPWRIHGFEVRILDRQNRLADARQVALDKHEVFVVQSGQEHAFDVRLYLPLLTQDSRLVVRVQTATDGRERYQPDEW